MATQAPTRPAPAKEYKGTFTPQTPPPATNGAAPKPETDKHVIAGKPALESALNRLTEFMPFQAKSTIKLSAAIVLEHFCTPTKKGHKCTTSQAIRFIMLCRSRGLNPWEGDAFIVGYDTDNGPSFSLITAHQAYLKRAEINPEYDGMESGVIARRGKDENAVTIQYEGDYVEPGDIAVGGWARVYSKRKKVSIYRRLSLAVMNKGFGQWKSNAVGMVVKCAEADALRSAFPNTYGGMALEQVMDSEVMADAAAEIAALPGNGADSHPEQPPFDREAVIRSIKAQYEQAIGSGVVADTAMDALLTSYNANKLEDLTDEQLNTTEEQIARSISTTAPVAA